MAHAGHHKEVPLSCLVCQVFYRKSDHESPNLPGIRDGETTLKVKFALLRGVGLGDREENRSKTLFFVGKATTTKS